MRVSLLMRLESHIITAHVFTVFLTWTRWWLWLYDVWYHDLT